MKILLINSLYWPHVVGGAERSVQFLAEELVRQGHSMVVMATSPNRGLEIREIDGVRVYRIGPRNLYWPHSQGRPFVLRKAFWHAVDAWNPLMHRAISRVLESEQPDVVHTNNLSGFSPHVWRTIKKRKIPLVHTIRDYYLICPRSTMFKKGENCAAQCGVCKLYSAPKKALSGCVDIVVGISQFVLSRHLELNYFSGAVAAQVIHNSYQPNRGLHTCTSSFGEKVRFGFLGRVTEAKGIEILLEATTKLPEIGWSLDIAGDGDSNYLESLRHKYQRDQIHFLGHTEPNDFFSRIDVLVTPSIWHEPLSRTIIEAYSFGKPVIGSALGGIPEIIEEGRTGWLFHPSESNSLENCLVNCMTDPGLPTRVGKNCLAKAKCFKPKHIASQYLQVYRDAQRTI